MKEGQVIKGVSAFTGKHETSKLIKKLPMTPKRRKKSFRHSWKDCLVRDCKKCERLINKWKKNKDIF
jgi:hypothetical protein